MESEIIPQDRVDKVNDMAKDLIALAFGTKGATLLPPSNTAGGNIPRNRLRTRKDKLRK